MAADNSGDNRTETGLERVAAWVFDLDNTLYPASCDLFPLIEHRMGVFIALRLGTSYEAADRLRTHFFQKYGTTLRGLMLEHGVDPEEFLDYVHDIELTSVQPNPSLGRVLAALPGRKLVFTNASRGHADRVIDRLGIAGCFESVYDIADAGYQPKPEPASYAGFIARHDIEPARACMIDDMARNLVPAALFGMTTVWIRSDSAWGLPTPEDMPHIHHVADDLPGWLAGLVFR